MPGEDDLELLAAEYALGVLSGEERAAVERRLAREPGFLARVEAWQERLAPLGEDMPPVTPRPEVWQRIRRSLPGTPSRPGPAWWQRLGFWRGWAGLATAAALALGVVALEPVPAPRLVAVLTDAQGRPIWVVGAASGEAGLLARPVAAAADAARVPQLWLLPVGASRPVSLGLLDPTSENRRTLEALPPEALAPGALVEVSLEPPGGSPTGLPTGPVISKGFLVASPP
jgi:anti-sigma-K factor RskA